MTFLESSSVEKKGRVGIAAASAILALLVLAIYSNTLNSPWILDDHNNILNEPALHIESVDGGSLWNVILFSVSKGKLDRPLARLSFALNWYFGGADTWGYHVVNITIHMLCAIFVFVTIRALFQTPRGITSHLQPDRVIFLAAALWAANPIQTQAVTYIVQRMTCLAGLFYVIGLWAYLRARLTAGWANRLRYSLICLTAFVLAVSTKENAIMLPLALALAEFIFFPDSRLRRMPRKAVLIAVGAAGLIAAAAIALFLHGHPLSTLNYDFRYFTLAERLLTQPRILLFYLSQIFFPAPFRLSIEHDVTVSTSLFDPWSTLPSIIVVFVAVSVAVWKYKDWPFASFGILFFFLNHLVESSIIPLELIFEHRNYLPSMFLFVPVAYGLCQAMERFRQRADSVHKALGGVAALLLLCFAIGTYLRNQAWESPALLWEDAARKAPMSSRALANVALFQPNNPEGEKRALELYNSALSLTKNNRMLESEIYNNIAAIHYGRREFQKAEEFWFRAVQSRPEFLKARYRLALTMTQMGRLEDALTHLNRVISEDLKAIPAMNLRGSIYFMRNDLLWALEDFKAVIQSDSNQFYARVNAGAVMVASGHTANANSYLLPIPADAQEYVAALLWQIKAALVEDNEIHIKSWLNRLNRLYPTETLLANFENMKRITFESDRVLLPAFDDHEILVLRKLLFPRHQL